MKPALTARAVLRLAPLACLTGELWAWLYGAYAHDDGIVAAALTHLPPALWIAPPLLVLALAILRRECACIALAAAAFLVACVPIGGFTLRSPQKQGPHPISLLTFNVEKWSHGAEAVSSVIIASGTDLFCLQESGDYDYVPHMAEQRRSFDARLASYRLLRAGELIVGARLPVLRTNVLPLPPGPESRSLLEVVVQSPDGAEISILATHLVHTGQFSLSPRGLHLAARARLQQAERITTYAAKLDHPAILCGDLNSGFRSAALAQLATQFRDAWRERGLGFGLTFSTVLRSRRVDYILVRDLQVDSINVVTTQTSDHYPLLAVLEPPSLAAQ